MLSVAHAVQLYRIKVHLERFSKRSAGRLVIEDEIHSVQGTFPVELTPVFTLTLHGSETLGKSTY